MITTRTVALLLTVVVGTGLGACSSDGSKKGSTTSGSASAPAASSTAAPAPAAKAPAAVAKPTEPRVYFDYNMSQLDSADTKILKGWAAYLAANPSVRVTLEGHCDERGSTEYNVSLGERRANSARSYLQSAGVAANQISVVSYGESQPAVDGHTEAAWSKNRRVEIKLK